MPRGFSLSKNLTRDTLLFLAKAGIMAIALTSPYFLHQVAKNYFKDASGKLIRARAKKLRELEQRKLIDFKELENGSVRIELTHKGKNLVRNYTLEEMRLKKPKKWDGMWHILLYDIPTAQRKASMAFKEKIKQLGLYPLQRSIWISPYDCLPEIEFLAGVFEIDFAKCICYFRAKEIPREKEIKSFFDL